MRRGGKDLAGLWPVNSAGGSGDWISIRSWECWRGFNAPTENDSIWRTGSCVAAAARLTRFIQESGAGPCRGLPADTGGKDVLI